MNPTVSIIIPVYRCADTLRRCVESLVNGTFQDLEILLIEDCSPDESWTVCQQLQADYPCVRAFRNEQNGGPSVTRNRGLEEMRGQLLLFVDSDDWVEPDYVETFLSVWQTHGSALSVCGYWNHDEAQNAAVDIFCPAGDAPVTTAPLRSSMLPLLNHRLLQMIWNKGFDADIIRTHQLRFDPAIRIGEDFRFLIRYLEHLPGDDLIQINRPLYHYIRAAGGSLMFSFGSEDPTGIVADLEALYIFMGIPEAQRQEMLARDREERIQTAAYLIMHNLGMPMKERRRRILGLDTARGKALYRWNLLLYYKERLAVALKRLLRR